MFSFLRKKEDEKKDSHKDYCDKARQDLIRLLPVTDEKIAKSIWSELFKGASNSWDDYSRLSNLNQLYSNVLRNELYDRRCLLKALEWKQKIELGRKADTEEAEEIAELIKILGHDPRIIKPKGK
jgi:hypothetical protein